VAIEDPLRAMVKDPLEAIAEGRAFPVNEGGSSIIAGR
jgi:hypothetical protein